MGDRFIATKWMVLITMAVLSVQAPAAQTARTQPSAIIRQTLRKQAATALAAETSGDETNDCPDAVSTRDIEGCLGKELSQTQKNYTIFISALRAMLNQSGGISATADFDKIESESKQYQELCVKAASDQFKGGTMAPIAALQVRRKLLRFHLQELSAIYANQLQDH